MNEVYCKQLPKHMIMCGMLYGTIHQANKGSVTGPISTRGELWEKANNFNLLFC